MNTEKNETSALMAEVMKRQHTDGHGPGAGLGSLGDALAAAGMAGGPARVCAPRAAGVEAMPIAEALASGEPPAGALLLECQGQADLCLSENCARKLAVKMRGSGATVSEDNIQDGKAAGALALTQWRATGMGVDGAPETLAARVAWRAVVRAMSADAFGESIPLHTVGEDWLWHNGGQGSESPRERAARILVARAASKRQERLGKRMASLPMGKGKRAQVIDKVARAASLLLDGFGLDTAAGAVGFNARAGSSRHSAADALLQACRRMGLIVKTGAGGQQFTARLSTRAD